MKQTTVALIAKTATLINSDSEIYSDLKRILGQDDIRLCQFEHWMDALAHSAKEMHPHLIILDCPESGIGALSECHEIRSRYSGPLVIVVENKDSELHVLALDLGADGYFPKATGATIIASNIKALLRRALPPVLALTLGWLPVHANRRVIFGAGQP